MNFRAIVLKLTHGDLSLLGISHRSKCCPMIANLQKDLLSLVGHYRCVRSDSDLSCRLCEKSVFIGMNANEQRGRFKVINEYERSSRDVYARGASNLQTYAGSRYVSSYVREDMETMYTRYE